MSNQNNVIHLTKNEVIEKYIARMQKIKRKAKFNEMSGPEFDNFVIKTYFSNCVAKVHQTERLPTHSTNRIKKKKAVWLLILIMVLVVSFVIVYYRNVAASLFMKNIQNFIYPGMSLWRTLTVPIIKTFPELTELYDETCLLSNPLFQIKDLDCRPCMSVLNIFDLTNIEHQSSADVPYIFKVIFLFLSLCNVLYHIIIID